MRVCLHARARCALCTLIGRHRSQAHRTEAREAVCPVCPTVCVCVCVCVPVSVPPVEYACVQTCAHADAHVCVSVSASVCVYVCVRVCAATHCQYAQCTLSTGCLSSTISLGLYVSPYANANTTGNCNASYDTLVRLATCTHNRHTCTHTYRHLPRSDLPPSSHLCVPVCYSWRVMVSCLSWRPDVCASVNTLPHEGSTEHRERHECVYVYVRVCASGLLPQCLPPCVCVATRSPLCLLPWPL